VDVAEALVSSTYDINPADLGKITQKEFNKYLHQAFNIVNYKAGGKLETESIHDKIKRINERIKK
jgi:hypothetical protein